MRLRGRIIPDTPNLCCPQCALTAVGLFGAAVQLSIATGFNIVRQVFPCVYNLITGYLTLLLYQPAGL
jgi:hypothetical protein